MRLSQLTTLKFTFLISVPPGGLSIEVYTQTRNKSYRENIHSYDVTSDLARPFRFVHHRQGGGGRSRASESTGNSFVLKILTSKLFALKILQTIFANPAPSKAFRGMGGGGVASFIIENSKKDALPELFWAEIHRPEAPKPAC